MSQILKLVEDAKLQSLPKSFPIYERNYEEFESWCISNNINNLEKITPDVLLAYAKFKIDNHVAPTSINSAISGIRSVHYQKYGIQFSKEE